MTALFCDMITELMYNMETMSSDRHTRVGCVVTDANRNILVTGANTVTVGMESLMTDSMYDRPEKYDWIEHAERNAIFSSADRGISLRGSHMHLPGFPCVECARAIVQSGIAKLFHGSTNGWDEERYKFGKSRKILEAAGVELIERKTVYDSK